MTGDRLTERFIDALAFAARVHAGQVRKGTNIPYIAHVLGVASIALEYGANEDEAIGALLHDTIEDQGIELRAEVISRFGDRVAAIVDGCTDVAVARGQPKPPWIERKRAYLAHLPAASRSVQLVSAADKLHNVRAILRDLRNIGDEVWQRFNADRADVLAYYGALADIFLASGLGPLAAELDRTVRDLERAAGATRQHLN